MGVTPVWKFVHAADLHIDSPMRGLARYDSAPAEAFRAATRRAFENIVDLCLAEDARLLLLAGDVFDGEWKDYNTGLFFRSQLARLRETGARACLVRGNHDAASSVARELTLPEHVLGFGVRAPETRALEDLGVAVHGVSFANRAVTDNLVPLFPQPVRGLLNLGLLHTNVAGQAGHDNYAPSTVAELAAKGYDYWALGHVHQNAMLSAEPHIVYSGCAQGRSVRECGPKGCYIVSVEDGAIAGCEFAPTDAARWEVLEIAAPPDGDALQAARDALSEACAQADGRPLAARLRCSGPGLAGFDDAAARDRLLGELRALPQDLGADVWIEKVELRASSGAGPGPLEGGAGLLAELARAAREASEDEERLADLAGSLTDLVSRGAGDLREAGFDLSDGTLLRDLLERAEALLAARLGGVEP